jgi:hypothetical protein
MFSTSKVKRSQKFIWVTQQNLQVRLKILKKRKFTQKTKGDNNDEIRPWSLKNTQRVEIQLVSVIITLIRL